MPAKGSKAEFKNPGRTMPINHVVYADLEASLVRLDNIAKGDQTNVVHHHVANSYCMLTISRVPDEEPWPLQEYYGPDDIMEHFVQSLMTVARKVRSWQISSEQVPKNDADFERLPKKECCICNKVLLADIQPIHRHHDHTTGLSIGFAHAHCNLRAVESKEVQLIIHAGLHYDVHMFLRALADHVAGGMQVLADTEENYKTLKWTFECDDCRKAKRSCRHFAPMRLLDSYCFLDCTLSKLVTTYKGAASFDALKGWCRSNLAEDRVEKGYEYLLRKNLYPYEMVESMEILENTTEMPPIDKFYSSLLQEGPSLADYKFAREVWDFFGCQNLLDYHKLYLRCDVLLLADCFEIFRKTCLAEQHLDPAYYIGLPGFAWDAMFRATGVKLDLLDDCDMYNMFESSVRGGLSQVGSLRSASANNKYMKNHDKNKPTSYLLDLDANNLYGCAMVRLLPTGDFQWMDDSEMRDLENALTLGTLIPLELGESERGMTLEVDLHYPDELHDLHNDLPLCPENIVPKQEWLSPDQIKMQEMYNLPPPKDKKLIAHFFPREKIVLHWYVLKLYMELGMQVTKVHRVITYKHSTWLREWVMENAKKRANTLSEILRKLYKDLNNILYGKMLQGCRDLLDIRLKNSWKTCKRLVAKPTFKSATVFAENLVAVHMYKPEVLLNRPIYVGASILDLAKAHVYMFWYKCVKTALPQARLMLTDTDSLLLYVEDECFYDSLREIVGELDFSNYSVAHELFDRHAGAQNAKRENRMCMGKWKDVHPKSQIVDCKTVCSKVYSFITDDDSNVMRHKGVQTRALEKQLSHINYCDSLLLGRNVMVTYSAIRNFNHEVYTIHGKKVALSCYDDKRYICENRIETFALGHCRLRSDPLKTLVESTVLDDDDAECAISPPSI